jgi:hypothetical protein
MTCGADEVERCASICWPRIIRRHTDHAHTDDGGLEDARRRRIRWQNEQAS